MQQQRCFGLPFDLAHFCRGVLISESCSTFGAAGASLVSVRQLFSELLTGQ